MKHLLCLLALSVPLCARADQPNVVLINADDLGINDLRCYGRKDHHTPHLDGLAKQGLRFGTAYVASPICSPSRAALMTGKHPARLHITTYIPGRPDTRSQKLLHPKMRMQLPLEEKTLAEHLKEAGYATGIVGKWHLGGKGFTPDKQGFDFVFAGRANTAPSDKEGGKGEYELTAKAIEFIEKNRSKPFFLYVAHNNPHIPLAAKPDLVKKNKDAYNPVYAACVETLDESVGLLLKRLDELKLSDRTIVIFTSDNGGLHVPELKEDAPTHNTPYRAGKGFLYEGGLRVPLIVRWPGKVKAGGVVETPVVNVDLLPTLLALCGCKVPDNLDGEDVSGLWLGKARGKERTFYWHNPHYNNQGGRPAGAVRQGKWKYVEPYDGGKPELYDLDADPGESKDLASSEKERVGKMAELLGQWRKSVKAQTNTPNEDFDEKFFRKLYVETDVSRLKPEKTGAATRKKLEAWRKLMDEVVRMK
jgi:arylsulfatase A-like enzyme